MSLVKEQANVSNPFARNVNSQMKKVQQPQQKVDTARENVKKQMMEAFEVQNESVDAKFTNEALVSEIENLVFELTGKNSKDKAYREKAKKILTRLKGGRNAVVRNLLRSGTITPSELVKMNDKQLDDDSYFDKFAKNGNSVQNENKPKGASIKPPNFKNIPVQANIDLSNQTEVNEYFNSINKTEENQNEGESNPREIEEEKNLSQLNNFSNLESNNFNDDNMSNRVQTEIETNSVRTDTFSIREDNREVPAEIGKISPKMNNGRTVQFNPPSRNVAGNLPNANQTFDLGANRNLNIQKEILNNTVMINSEINTSAQVGVKNEKVQSKNENLERLKELMEKKKQSKNASAGGNKVNISTSQIQNQNQNQNQNQSESSKIASSISLESKNINKEQELIINTGELDVNPNSIPINQEKSNNEPIYIEENSHKKLPEENVEAEQNHSPYNRNPFDSPDVRSINESTKKVTQPKRILGKSSKNITNPLNPLNPVKKPSQTVVNPQPILPNQPKSIFDGDHREHRELGELRDNINTVDINSAYEINKNSPESPIIKKEEVERDRNEVESEIQKSPNFSPKNELGSEFTHSNIRNTNTSRDQSFISIKDKIRNFQETKVSLETQLELSAKRCEVYEREMQNLRKTVNELKLQLSRTNEETYKLEISKLKQHLVMSDKEKEMLKRENQNLKSQLKKYEENIESIIDENRKFRNDTQRKFVQYNKEIENLTIRSSNVSAIPFSLKESIIEKKEDLKERDEENYNVIYESNIQPKRENKKLNNNFNANSNYLNQSTHGNENISIMNQNKSNIIEIDNEVQEGLLMNVHNENNFTNGSPNLIEEVGADNYLNMNGNTYDEMKDLKQDDNLHDHQYYENNNMNSLGVNNPVNYDPINMEYTNFNNKKSNTGNTGDAYNNTNMYLNTNSGGGESGATNNIFGNPEEEKGDDQVESVFEHKSIVPTKNVKPVKIPEKVVHRPVVTTHANVNANHINHNNNNFSSQTHKPAQPKKNLFEDNNAFDIFDPVDNAENIFESISKKAPKANKNNKDLHAHNLFDS